MKRMHVHVGVAHLGDSVRFYSALFGRQPAKLKPDDAKWMLDDPHLNFAISTRSGKIGVDHMGFQVEDGAELAALDVMMAHPILINRPIVITDNGVKFCRPSEAVLDLLTSSQRAAFNKEDGERVASERGERIGAAGR